MRSFSSACRTISSVFSRTVIGHLGAGILYYVVRQRFADEAYLHGRLPGFVPVADVVINEHRLVELGRRSSRTCLRWLQTAFLRRILQ